MDLRKLIVESKNIAVLGMSASEYKPSHTVPKYFSDLGWNIFPINPVAEEIIGLKVYKNLMEIPHEIDLLNVFRPSREAVAIVEQAIERRNIKGDIKAIWFQEGIANQEAKELAEANGFVYVENKCMYQVY